MYSLLSVVLSESSFNAPQYVVRKKPKDDDDSGFRFYLAFEKGQGLGMIHLCDTEDYMKDMLLYDLLRDMDYGYRLDIRSSNFKYPRVFYKDHEFRFSSLGLWTLVNARPELDGFEPRDNLYFLPFSYLTWDEKLLISWHDKALFKPLK